MVEEIVLVLTWTMSDSQVLLGLDIGEYLHPPYQSLEAPELSGKKSFELRLKGISIFFCLPSPFP